MTQRHTIGLLVASVLAVIATTDVNATDKLGEQYRHAKKLLLSRKLTQAREAGEQILLSDPYHVPTIRLLRLLDERFRETAGEGRRGIRWKWPDDLVRVEDMPVKFSQIIIPKIEFDEECIGAALAEIQALSAEHDAEHTGIEVVSKLSQGSQGRKVSMVLTGLPVGELLRYVCLAAGLKLSIREGVAAVEEKQDGEHNNPAHRSDVTALADSHLDTVAASLERGQVFLRNRRYADARVLFEQILARDPYEVRAIAYLRQLNDELRKVRRERQSTARDGNIDGDSVETDGIHWRWAEPVSPGAGPGIAAFVARLESIVIPPTELKDASADEIVGELRRLAREHDPERKGIDIILQRRPEGDAMRERPVTTTFADKALLDVVSRVCVAAGLEWGITDQAVLLRRKKQRD